MGLIQNCALEDEINQVRECARVQGLKEVPIPSESGLEKPFNVSKRLLVPSSIGLERTANYARILGRCQRIYEMLSS